MPGYAIKFPALPAFLVYRGTLVNVEVIVQSELLDDILLPRFWLKSEYVTKNKLLLKNNPMALLNIRSFFCFEVLNNLVVLLTLGLCSPILACAIVFVVVVKMNMRLLLLGRFASIVS